MVSEESSLVQVLWRSHYSAENESTDSLRLPKLSEEASGSIISLFAEKQKLSMRERMKSIQRIHEGDKMQVYEKINKTSWKLFGLDYEQSLLFGEVGRAYQKKKISENGKDDDSAPEFRLARQP